MGESIDKYINMQRLFRELYGKGLVGVSDTYIQLTPEKFKEFCPKDVIPEISKNGESITLEFTTEEGTRFLTLI